MTNWFCTLDQARQEIKVSDGDTRDDDRVKRLIPSLSDAVKERSYDFLPRIETVTRYLYRSTRLVEFPYPLLSITSITGADDATISSSLYELLDINEQPVLAEPAYTIRFDNASFAYDSNGRVKINITGVWGYRKRYSEAWVDSLDTVQNDPLAADGATVTVQDGDGVNRYGLTPRFSPGQLLRFGTGTDWAFVYAVSGNTLSVIRNVRGGTGAEQAQGTAIYVYEPEPAIAREVAKWVAMEYTYQGSFEYKTFDLGAGVQQTRPKVMPASLEAALDNLNTFWAVI